MKLSTAQLIVDQTRQIAELERGLNDILLSLNDPTHMSVKNTDAVVQLIIDKIRRDAK